MSLKDFPDVPNPGLEAEFELEMLLVTSLEGAPGCNESLFPQIIFNLSQAQLGRADKSLCP